MAAAWIGLHAPPSVRARKWWSDSVAGSSLYLSRETQCRSCSSARKTSAVAALRTSGGFGKRPETKARPKILKELEVSKVDKVDTYKIFARKVAGEKTLSEWESIGQILIESGASIEIALKERKSSLAAGVKYQHPVLVILEKGEAVEYGVQLLPAKEDSDSASKDGEAAKQEDQKEAEITVVDVSGKQPEETVSAILRVEDGKSPGNRARKF